MRRPLRTVVGFRISHFRGLVAEGATAFPTPAEPTLLPSFLRVRLTGEAHWLFLRSLLSTAHCCHCRWQRYQNPGSSHDLPTRISKSAEIRRQWVQEVHGYLGTMRQTSSGRRARTSSALSRHSIGKEAILRARHVRAASSLRSRAETGRGAVARNDVLNKIVKAARQIGERHGDAVTAQPPR